MCLLPWHWMTTGKCSPDSSQSMHHSHDIQKSIHIQYPLPLSLTVFFLFGLFFQSVKKKKTEHRDTLILKSPPLQPWHLLSPGIHPFSFVSLCPNLWFFIFDSSSPSLSLLSSSLLKLYCSTSYLSLHVPKWREPSLWCKLLLDYSYGIKAWWEMHTLKRQIYTIKQLLI